MKALNTVRTLEYSGRAIPYTLQRSRRKSITITVTPERQVCVKAPLRSSERYIRQTLENQARWIERQLKNIRILQRLPAPQTYTRGTRIAYLGRTYVLRIRRGPKTAPLLRNGNLHLSLPEPENSEAVRRAVEAWYRKRAEFIFTNHLERCLQTPGLPRIKRPHLLIRKMRSRWGSCCSSGEITLSLQLIQTPSTCIRYVIMHEVCHLRHHDHSKAFYNLLSQVMPDWKKRKHILDTLHFSSRT
jgi:hypothetical protein